MAAVIVGGAGIRGEGLKLTVFPHEGKNFGVALFAKVVELNTVFHKTPAFFVAAWVLVVQHKGIVKVDIVVLNRNFGGACAVVVPAHLRTGSALAAESKLPNAAHSVKQIGVHIDGGQKKTARSARCFAVGCKAAAGWLRFTVS